MATMSKLIADILAHAMDIDIDYVPTVAKNFDISYSFSGVAGDSTVIHQSLSYKKV